MSRQRDRMAQTGLGHVAGLNLVLALDGSASVNYEEFDLVTHGTADAFRDPDVQAAIAATQGGIRVCIVQWSSIRKQAVTLDWTFADGPAAARTLADQVATMPRTVDGGGTMIHAGLSFAAMQYATAPGPARRKVIDVSGNGPDDDPEALRETRARLIGQGITINGLAVHEDDPGLSAYFRDWIIGGPGAFAIAASDFDDFARAMRRKLLREISGPHLT